MVPRNKPRKQKKETHAPSLYLPYYYYDYYYCAFAFRQYSVDDAIIPTLLTEYPSVKQQYSSFIRFSASRFPVPFPLIDLIRILPFPILSHLPSCVVYTAKNRRHSSKATKPSADLVLR